MDLGKLVDLRFHAQKLLLRDAGIEHLQGWEKNPICPFKGRCYETTVAVYELMDGDGFSLYRKKDIYDVWHWFMVIDHLYEKRQNEGYEGEFIVDITGRQYRHPIPSPTHKVRYGKRGEELMKCDLMKKPLHYPSYKEKVEKFKKRILESMDSSKQPSRRVSILDFVEQDKQEKTSSDIEKPVTLDDFFT